MEFTKNKIFTKPLLKRLIFLDKEISSGTYPNKNSISKKYQISLKTVQRDIDFLKTQYDAPIEYDFTRKGFYYYREFSLCPLKLSEGDFFMLAVTEKVLEQYKDSPIRERVMIFFEKIKILFNDEISIYSDELDTIMSFDIGPLRNVKKEYFDKLEKAIRERYIVEITYHSNYNNTDSLRKIDPLHLKNYKGDWYLIAYCHSRNDIRLFALSRIKSFKLKDIQFRPHTDFNIEDIMKTSFGIYINKKISNVKIKFSAFQSRWIKEKVWHPSQQIKGNKDGSIVLSLKVNNLEELKRWVLQYGKEAEVITPKVLRNDMKKEFEEGMKIYKNNHNN